MCSTSPSPSIKTSNRRSVNKMSKKWYGRAKKILGQGDEILKGYPSRMKGKFGWLIISSHRILFLSEIGFIHKDYSLIFDKKRDNIKSVCKIGSHGLSINDSNGNISKFTFNQPSEIICKYLGTWIGSLVPMDKHDDVMIHD